MPVGSIRPPSLLYPALRPVPPSPVSETPPFLQHRRHAAVSFISLMLSIPFALCSPKPHFSSTLGNGVRQPLGRINDPDAFVLPGWLPDPGDQQLGIGIADSQQWVNLPPEGIRG